MKNCSSPMRSSHASTTQSGVAAPPCITYTMLERSRSLMSGERAMRCSIVGTAEKHASSVPLDEVDGTRGVELLHHHDELVGEQLHVRDAEAVRVVQRRGDQLRQVVGQVVEVARHRDASGSGSPLTGQRVDDDLRSPGGTARRDALRGVGARRRATARRRGRRSPRARASVTTAPARRRRRRRPRARRPTSRAVGRAPTSGTSHRIGITPAPAFQAPSAA